MNHAPTSRTREQPVGDEEATTELRLGEFQHEICLSLSEARILVDAVVDRRAKDGGKMAETETLIKTQDYLEMFARFKQKENVEAVERVLAQHPELELFEQKQLGSLCCETSDEAKTLIPSLADKIAQEDLDALLADITKLRSFIE